MNKTIDYISINDYAKEHNIEISADARVIIEQLCSSLAPARSSAIKKDKNGLHFEKKVVAEVMRVIRSY